ncbi:MAG: fibronectin type III domain-containing protein [Acidobacteriota bacterium]
MSCKPMHSPRPHFGLALLLAALLPTTGCGKQGDPLPPLRTIPAPAQELAVQQRGSELMISFEYPNRTTSGAALAGIDEIELWQLERAAILPPPPPPPAEETAEEEAPQEAAPEEPAAEIEASGEGSNDAEEPVPPASESASDPPAEDPTAQYQLPSVEAREFAGAATRRLSLRGEDLQDAVEGSRIALRLPYTPSVDEGSEEAGDTTPTALLLAVRTRTAEGETSGFSNFAGIIPRVPPPAVTALTVEEQPDGVQLSWTFEDAADDTYAGGVPGFAIYRRDASSRGFDEPLQLVGDKQRRFKDLDATYGKRYVYSVTRVAQRRPRIESAIGAAREVAFEDRFAPPDPTGVVGLSEQGRIRLLWNAVDAPDLAGYRVYRRDTGMTEWTALTRGPVQATEYVDTGLAVGQSLDYRVTALDAIGNESAGEDVITAPVR